MLSCDQSQKESPVPSYAMSSVTDLQRVQLEAPMLFCNRESRR